MIKIGLVKDNKSTIGSLIRWAGKWQTGDARFNHVFLLIDDEIVIEEKYVGLRISSIDEYHKRADLGGVYFELYAPTFLGKAQKERIKIEAFKQVGTYNGIYGYTKFPLFILDSLFRTYWFTSNLSVKHFKVCSQWVCYLLYKYGCYEPFKAWRRYSPDGIDDHFTKVPKKFKLVYKSD